MLQKTQNYHHSSSAILLKPYLHISLEKRVELVFRQSSIRTYYFGALFQLDACRWHNLFVRQFRWFTCWRWEVTIVWLVSEMAVGQIVTWGCWCGWLLLVGSPLSWRGITVWGCIVTWAVHTRTILAERVKKRSWNNTSTCKLLPCLVTRSCISKMDLDKTVQLAYQKHLSCIFAQTITSKLGSIIWWSTDKTNQLTYHAFKSSKIKFKVRYGAK